MVLNYEQIKQKNILTGHIEDNYNNAVYDVRIGKIITMKGDEVDTYKIPPQGMAVVISQEQLAIPANIVGYAHVRTSLSSKGIMAINIGIIDPGYCGNLSSTLLNFGKEEFSIQSGERFLRTTFHELNSVAIDKLATSKNAIYEQYVVTKKVEALKYMDEKFMSFDKEVKLAINKSWESIIKYAGGVSATVALVALTITLSIFLINYIYNIFKTDSSESYKYQLQLNQSKYELLEHKYESLQSRLDSLLKKQEEINTTNKKQTTRR
jgi:deoxycytidine triphosphate deaminase